MLREAWRLGLVDAESYHRAVDLPSIRAERLPRGRALAAGELRALFAICAGDDSPSGARDAAILAVLYGGGLRRSELVALKLENYDQATGALTVRGGKGRKDRVGYATNGALDALQAWIEARGREPGARRLLRHAFARRRRPSPRGSNPAGRCKFWSCLGYVDGLELGVEDVHHGKNETVSAEVPATDY